MQRFGRLSSLPSPRQVAVYLEGAAVDGTLVKATIVTMRRLLIGYIIGLACRTAVGTADRALEAVAGHDWNASPRSTGIAECLLGAACACCGSDKRKPPCFSWW